MTDQSDLPSPTVHCGGSEEKSEVLSWTLRPS
jgi:hypothetical protein